MSEFSHPPRVPSAHLMPPVKALPVSARTKYVVGFLIDLSQDRVLLVRKNRPDWQRGLLNGIGGHVEEGETAYDAMCREFKEETSISWLQWNLMVTMFFPGAVIFFYKGHCDRTTLNSARTMTDENIADYHIPTVMSHHAHIPNLNWLLPLAAYTADHYSSMTVNAAMANPEEIPE